MEKKKTSTLTILILILLAIPCGCCMLGSLGSSDTPNPQESYDKPETSERDVEPEIEVQEDPNTELVDYLNSVLEITGSTSDAMLKIGIKASESPDFYLWTEAEEIEFAGWMATVQTDYARLAELVPPVELQGVHNKYLDGMRLYSEAMADLAYGIDMIDPDSIERATLKMEQGNLCIEEATRMMGE